ncbi:MAG: RimJ/RimL family protein N-acetyltransferase [Halioglobus sp.]|jgi:RimJ/RimL family protein N-acetyltransferase
MIFEKKAPTLIGGAVRIEPLSQEHAQGLFNRGQYRPDWDFMPRACFVDLADTRQWIDEALDTPAQQPFALVETGKRKAVGSTRFLNMRPEHKSLEIGWTWLGQDWQRTAINTEAKLLLMTHAFECLGCLRVEFKADSRNLRSQRALERTGATREGLLRNHMVVQREFSRDSVYFSVIESEWDDVKQRLIKLSNR